MIGTKIEESALRIRIEGSTISNVLSLCGSISPPGVLGQSLKKCGRSPLSSLPLTIPSI